MSSDPRQNPRYQSLDLWRGVACLMVVLHHSGFALGRGEAEGSPLRLAVVWFVRQMDLGVPLFFVISGYCIVASMDGIRRRNAGPWTFLRRRVRRIYPPYWASLLIFIAILGSLDYFGLYRLHDGGHSLKLLSPGAPEPAQWLGNATLTETWRPRVFGGPPMEVYTRVAWSLCYEEQFYLLCFLTLLLAPRRLFRGLAILTGAILAFRVFAYDSGRLHRYEGMFPILWHEFAIGIAVYWRLVHAQTTRSKRVIEALVAALLAIGLVSGFRSTIVAAGFGLALIALRRNDEAVSRVSWLAPLRACGRRSYSIYLVHLPICTVGNELLVRLGLVEFWTKVFVLIPLVSIASVAFGWLCFAIVEVHFLNAPSDHRHHSRALAGEESMQAV
jgi:peptidoglycan/LPS O-acetylase OafA/YrhL